MKYNRFLAIPVRLKTKMCNTKVIHLTCRINEGPHSQILSCPSFMQACLSSYHLCLIISLLHYLGNKPRAEPTTITPFWQCAYKAPWRFRKCKFMLSCLTFGLEDFTFDLSPPELSYGCGRRRLKFTQPTDTTLESAYIPRPHPHLMGENGTRIPFVLSEAPNGQNDGRS